MAPKRGGGNAKKAAAGMSRDKEWVSSLMGETELNEMVEVGVLPNRVTAGWRPADGEPYPTPHTDERLLLAWPRASGTSFLAGSVGVLGSELV